jgi:hypothetical protein
LDFVFIGVDVGFTYSSRKFCTALQKILKVLLSDERTGNRTGKLRFSGDTPDTTGGNEVSEDA